MRHVYTQDFRDDAIRLAMRSGRSYAQVASDLGINYWTLRHWCRLEQMGKRSKKTGGSKAAAAPVAGETLEEKVARLERENAELRKQRDALEMDRAILKKAAAFFAKESE